jgi:hypothetical protein
MSQSCSPEGGEARALVVAGEITAGKGSPVRVATAQSAETDREQRQNREEECQASDARGERFFKKPDMGAPDSLQCLSGAHRTVHSSCPVNHQTAHRRMEF